MTAADLAAELLRHPNAEVLLKVMPDPSREDDFRVLTLVVYFEETNRFHLQDSMVLRIPAEWVVWREE